MPRSIAAKAKRGELELVNELERKLQKALEDYGPHTPLTFPNTVYYLPIILGVTGKAVEKISDLEFVLQEARRMLRGRGTRTTRTAALLAAEALETLRLATASAADSEGLGETELHFAGAIDDLLTRSWGIQLADGRMPGMALLLGCAKNDATAAMLVEELQRYNILCLLSGNVNGCSIIDQLQDEGMPLGSKTSILPLGTEPSSAVHALGFAARCAMKLGGIQPGSWLEILDYNKQRTFGFVLALDELTDMDYALATAANNFGFPLLLDTSIPGEDDREQAVRLVEQCLAVRGLELKLSSVDLPVAYGPAFEDELISNGDLHIQFGGKDSRAFELLQMASIDEIEDGKIEVVGEGFGGSKPSYPADLGIVVKVAGRKMQSDFEPVLERQIHAFLNYANGVQHTGQREAVSVRISNNAAAKGLTLESFGRILHTRFHEDFGTIIEKVQVTVITEPECHEEWMGKAQDAHDLQGERLKGLTDNQVDEFYTCSKCHSFAVNNVCIVSPERGSPCGRCNWLDARADFEMNPTGPHQPIKVGKLLDAKKGIWEGANNYAKVASHGYVSEVAMYSIMQNPLSACGALECIVMLIPEANGVMVVSQEDTSLTPAGITAATLASITAGQQTPGVMGIGKRYLLSPSFISAEGGFKRVVWMSSILKRSMAAEFKSVCEREGHPDLMSKIADENDATSVEELVTWLKAHNHPAFQMERMF